MQTEFCLSSPIGNENYRRNYTLKMLSSRIIRKIGSPLFALLVTGVVHAAEVQFSASVDSSQISLRDTVALKFIIKSKNSMGMGEPQFDAPDFQVNAEYSSFSVSSHYDASSGGFSSVNTQQLTKVLRPTR